MTPANCLKKVHSTASQLQALLFQFTPKILSAFSPVFSFCVRTCSNAFNQTNLLYQIMLQQLDQYLYFKKLVTIC